MFFCPKNACTLNTAFQIFSIVTKNRCHLRHRTFQKSQKYFYSVKNTRKICSNKILSSSLWAKRLLEEKPQQPIIVYTLTYFFTLWPIFQSVRHFQHCETIFTLFAVTHFSCYDPSFTVRSLFFTLWPIFLTVTLFSHSD